MSSVPPAGDKSPLLAIVGMFVLALAGVGLLALAVASLVSEPGQTAPPTVTAAATAEEVIFVPTTTPAPPTATTEPTLAATEAPPETAAPAESPTPAPTQTIEIILPANVRTGPGLTYDTVGGLNTGDRPTVIGRDAGGTWYAIDYPAAAGGVAWVSNLVSTFDGEVNSLPVIEASAPPPAATSAPPVAAAATATTGPTAAPTNTSPPPVSSARGIVANYFRVTKTTVAAGELIWFQFQVVNTAPETVAFGMLAGHTDVGFTAKSWNEALTAGRTLTHEDHIIIDRPGTYQLYLGICFNDSITCTTGAQAWERLSNYVTITVQ
jgi:uncharacterized protein YraI